LSLYRLGTIARRTGHTGAAIAALEEGLQISHSVGDRRAVAYIGYMLAAALADQGEPDRARPLLVEALAIFQELGHEAKQREARHLLDRLGGG
jgi:tetratricopeptide (TPR) repeat protein